MKIPIFEISNGVYNVKIENGWDKCFYATDLEFETAVPDLIFSEDFVAWKKGKKYKLGFSVYDFPTVKSRCDAIQDFLLYDSPPYSNILR